MICWKCGKENNIDSVFRNSECSSCHADLHSCKGCKFYAPGSHYDCKETVDSLVSDKEKANFCDFFQVGNSVNNNSEANKKAQDAKNAFNALFGD